MDTRLGIMEQNQCVINNNIKALSYFVVYLGHILVFLTHYT